MLVVDSERHQWCWWLLVLKENCHLSIDCLDSETVYFIPGTSRNYIIVQCFISFSAIRNYQPELCILSSSAAAAITVLPLPLTLAAAFDLAAVALAGVAWG